jgi:copper chaperone CopZ
MGYKRLFGKRLLNNLALRIREGRVLMTTTSTKTHTFELPAMYGDHHVVEVRRILLELPGVQDVYASSAFRIVEVTYDPGKINDLEISVKLDETGYLGEWTVTSEPDAAAAWQKNGKEAFRHTAAYEQTQQTVSFSQSVHTPGRPLWPCPGMGVIKSMED